MDIFSIICKLLHRKDKHTDNDFTYFLLYINIKVSFLFNFSFYLHKFLCRRNAYYHIYLSFCLCTLIVLHYSKFLQKITIFQLTIPLKKNQMISLNFEVGVRNVMLGHKWIVYDLKGWSILIIFNPHFAFDKILEKKIRSP